MTITKVSIILYNIYVFHVLISSLYCPQSLLQAHETARTKLRATQERMKRDYDVRVHRREFQEGDRVYLLDTATPKGKTKKLCPPWKGPATIIKKLSPYLYRISYRNSTFVVNHDRIKKCTDNSSLSPARSKGNNEILYCFCKQPDDGTLMIQCDVCDEWFHGRCVNITPGEAIKIDKYVCPFCKQK